MKRYDLDGTESEGNKVKDREILRYYNENKTKHDTTAIIYINIYIPLRRTTGPRKGHNNTPATARTPPAAYKPVFGTVEVALGT